MQNKKVTMSPDKPQQLKKITIKQFQWYEVETKVRELLTQLLQPFIKKQTEQSLKILEIRRTLTDAQEKINDHDFLLTQQQQSEGIKKPTYIQLQDQKLEDMQRRFNQLMVTQNHEIMSMKKVLEVYEQKIKHITNLQQKIQTQTHDRVVGFETQKQYVNQSINTMLGRLDSQDQQINSFRASTRNLINKIESRTGILENKMAEVENQMNRRINQIRKCNEDITSIREKAQDHQVRIEDLTSRINNREKDQKLSEKFFGKAVELTNEMSFIRNYLTLYQPLYIQMQISETMHSCLKGTTKTRLCLFQQKMFMKIHRNILDLEGDALQNRMGDYTNRIRKVINKNRKYVIKLRILETRKYGGTTYQIREIDENLLDQMEQQSSKPPPIIIPEEQIFSLVENKWQKLMKNLQGRIIDKIQPIKIWVNELQQQSLMRTVETQNTIDGFKKNLDNISSDISLEKIQIAQLHKQMEGNNNRIERMLKGYEDTIKDLVSFSSVLNHIIIQDEIDRQDMALYSLNSNKNIDQSVSPVIKLDEKCITCTNTNTSNAISQAFKIACLAYNPSIIKIQNKQYTREEILTISTGILQRLKRKSPNDRSLDLGEQKVPSYFTRNLIQQPQTIKYDSYRTISTSNRKRKGEYSTFYPNIGSIAKRKVRTPSLL